MLTYDSAQAREEAWGSLLAEARRERDEARNILGLVQQILWDDYGDVSTGCASGWSQALIRTRGMMRERDALREALQALLEVAPVITEADAAARTKALAALEEE